MNNFILCRSDDPDLTDDYYSFTPNKNITIQICEYAYPYIYSVNKWNEKTQTTTAIPCKSLKEAKQKTEEINNES